MNVFACPKCQSNLRASDEMRGKKVRCPQCSNIFTLGAAPDAAIPGPAPAPPDVVKPEESKPGAVAAGPPPVPPLGQDKPQTDPDDDLPRGKPMKRDDELASRSRRPSRYDEDDVALPRTVKSDSNWNVVSMGLLTLYVSLIGFVFAVLVGVLLMVIGGVDGVFAAGPRGAAQRPPFEFLAGACILVVAAGVSTLAYLVGTILCLFAPERRARMFVIGYVVSIAANLLLSCAQGAFSAVLRPQGPGARPNWNLLIVMMIIYVVSTLISLAGFVLFLLFLRRTAEIFDHPKLARNTIHFLVFQGVWLVVLLGEAALFVLVGMDGPPPAPGQIFAIRNVMLGVIVGTVIIGTLAYFGWFLSLLYRTRAAIRLGLEANERSSRDTHDW